MRFPLRRRFLQFSLRGLLIAVLVTAIMATAARHVIQRHAAEQRAIEELELDRIAVSIRRERPGWLPGFIPERFSGVFDRVVDLKVRDNMAHEERGYWQFASSFTDEHIQLVKEFRSLQRLDISSTDVTSQALNEFLEMRSLGAINVSGVGLSRDAIRHFQEQLPDCVVCNHFNLIEVQLWADGRIEIDGEQAPLNNAAALLRKSRRGPLAFGYTTRNIFLLLRVDEELEGAPRERMLNELMAMARSSGYQRIQVSSFPFRIPDSGLRNSGNSATESSEPGEGRLHYP